MSVTETNKVDSIGISADKKTLALLLTDHLNWENEHEHLLLLQEKINAYITFVESKQYTSIYPDYTFEQFVIELRFKEEPTEACISFLNVVNPQIAPLNMSIHAIVAD